MKLLNFILLLAVFLFGIGMCCMGQAEAHEESSPELYLGIMTEDREAVDSALIRIYNQDHKLLGEYYSSSAEGYANRIADPAVIDYYGWYYIEVSKAGYKTEEIKYELKNDGVIISAGVTLKRDDGRVSGALWMIASGILLVAGGWIYRWRKRKTR